jgi:carboxymethylenebutenolidase
MAGIALQSGLNDLSFGGLRARIAMPVAQAEAALLVLPSAMGLGTALDATLTSLMGTGLAVLAWDPFSAYPDDLPREERMRMSESVIEDEKVLREHRRCVDYLSSEMGMKRIGVIGFCMGGRMALRLASADERLGAVVAFYPTMREPRPANALDPVPAMASVRCPVQVHAPGRDQLTSRDAFAKLRASLDARDSAPTHFCFYPHATHGFLGRSPKDNAADAAASALAWPSALAFLKAAMG